MVAVDHTDRTDDVLIGTLADTHSRTVWSRGHSTAVFGI